MEPDIRLWLSAIFDHWLFSWGGIGLMVIAMIEKYREKPISKRIFSFLALACLVAAMFQAWDDEHKARVQSELKVSAPNTKPDFTLDIPQAVVLTIPSSKEGPLETDVFFVISVLNRGTKSSLRGWSAKVNLPTGDITIPYTRIVDGQKFKKLGTKETLTFKTKESIYEETLVSVDTGEEKMGWARFELPADYTKQVEEGSITFIVSCFDYLGKRYDAKYQSAPGSATPNYFPGLTDPVNKP